MFRNSEKKIFRTLKESICRVLKLENRSFVRLLSNTVKSKDAIEVSGYSNSAGILQKLLNLRSLIANDIVVKYKKFHKISVDSIEENYYCCIKNGVLLQSMQTYPEVLAEFDIPMKITELKRLPFDVNVTAPLLLLPYKTLKAFVDKEIKINRITIMSKLLKMEESEVCESLSRKTFLLTLNLNQLCSNVKFLTDNGISKDQIVKDLWVLRYSIETIKKRLDLARKNNVDLKTWMVRAQPEIFETYIKRRSDKKLILGNSSLTQYLSERLACTEEIAKYIISKQPALQNKSLKKMNEIIDFLFKYGFKPIHICRVPKILLHSVETTRKRLKELEAIGMHLDSLYILTKSQRQYMQYYESLIKTNKSKCRST